MAVWIGEARAHSLAKVLSAPLHSGMLDNRRRRAWWLASRRACNHHSGITPAADTSEFLVVSNDRCSNQGRSSGVGCSEVFFLVFSSAIRGHADGFPGLACFGLAVPDGAAKLDGGFAFPVVDWLKGQSEGEELVEVCHGDLKRTGGVGCLVGFAVLFQLLEQGQVEAGVGEGCAMGQKGISALSCSASRNWRCSRVETIEAVSFSAEG